MDYRDYSKKDLSAILYAVHDCTRCSSEQGLKALLSRVREMVGAEFSVCGYGKKSRGSITQPYIVNGNYPEQWLRLYTGNRLYNSDPVVLNTLRNPGAFLWEDSYRRFRGDASPLFVMSRDFGLCYGVAGGIYSEPAKCGTVFSFASGRNDMGEYQIGIIDSMSAHLHQAFLRVLKGLQAGRKNPLSAREMDVMKWIKAGKTNWETSVILNISERTVKFHIQNIEKKLDAVNKAHAIAILMEQGLLD